MIYKDYDSDKPYVVVHYEGLGVQESPLVEKETVAYCNTEEEANKVSNQMFIMMNSHADIVSSWTNNHYLIHINISTETGKQLLKKFKEKFDADLKEGIESGRYGEPIECDGNLIYIEKISVYDEQKHLSVPSTQSAEMIFLDFTKEHGDNK